MTHLVHTEAVRKTRRGAKLAARKRRTVTRERDPIFAAIDRCRQADAAFVAASHRFDETGTETECGTGTWLRDNNNFTISTKVK